MNQIALLTDENRKLKAALAKAIPWLGQSPDGPSWASDSAKARNLAMCDQAIAEAVACFPPEAIVHATGDVDAPI